MKSKPQTSIFVFVIFGIGIAANIKGCSYTVDDFGKYVRHVNGDSPDGFMLSIDEHKIREDFVAFYDLMIVTAAARDNFNLEYDPVAGDKVVDEFRQPIERHYHTL